MTVRLSAALLGAFALSSTLLAAPSHAQTATSTPFIKSLACNSVQDNTPLSCGATITLDHKHHFVIKTVSYSCNLGSSQNSLYEVSLTTKSSGVAGAIFLAPQTYLLIPAQFGALSATSTVSLETYADPGTKLSFLAYQNTSGDSLVCNVYITGQETAI